MRGQEKQLELSFTGGLVQQYPDFMDCVRASIYDNAAHKALKIVAADMDMSSSELSRRLSPAETQTPYRIEDFIAGLNSTGDFRPIYWLIEKYLESKDAKQKNAMDRLTRLIPLIESLVKEANGG